MEKKTKKPKFNFMDVVIVLITVSFVAAAVYFIINGMAEEKKTYKMAYTIKLEIPAADAGMISKGDSVLSSDGLSVIGTVSAVNVLPVNEYVIDRRPTAPTESETTQPQTTTTVTTAAESETEDTTATEYETETTAVQPQIIIVPGKDYGTRSGAVLSYEKNEDKVILLVTVLAEAKAVNNSFTIDGKPAKVGERAELMTPYYYAVGEYDEVAFE